jgi:hypothetical protein
MTEQSKPKVGNLELNKETVQELTEEQSERAQGGALAARGGGGRTIWSDCGGATCPGWECPLQ